MKFRDYLLVLIMGLGASVILAIVIECFLGKEENDHAQADGGDGRDAHVRHGGEG